VLAAWCQGVAYAGRPPGAPWWRGCPLGPLAWPVAWGWPGLWGGPSWAWAWAVMLIRFRSGVWTGGPWPDLVRLAGLVPGTWCALVRGRIVTGGRVAGWPIVSAMGRTGGRVSFCDAAIQMNADAA